MPTWCIILIAWLVIGYVDFLFSAELMKRREDNMNGYEMTYLTLVILFIAPLFFLIASYELLYEIGEEYKKKKEKKNEN